MRRPVAVALASSALLLAAAAPLLWTTLTGPSAEAVPPGQPSYDAYQLPRSPLPARRHRGGHGRRRRQRRDRPSWPPSQRGSRDRRRRPRHALRRAPRRRRLRQLRPRRAGASSGARRTRCARSAPLDAPGAATAGLRQHGRASSTRSRACSSTRRWSSAIIALTTLVAALPAHRLGPAAAEDAGDEHADPAAPRSASSSSPSRRAGSTARSTTPARRRSR